MKNESLQMENDQSIPLALICLKRENGKKNELFKKRKMYSKPTTVGAGRKQG